MNHKKTIVLIVSAIILLLGIGSNGPCYAGSATKTQKSVKKISIGSFSMQVPTDWRSYSSSESAELRIQFTAQQKEIYKQFSGSVDTSKTLDMSAFHLPDQSGSFVIVTYSIPHQSKLIKTLKSQIDEKMAWGIREGHIRKYIGLVSINNKKFSGFYTKAIGKDGNVEVSGGFEYKNKKNMIIQITLLSPKSWNVSKASDTLSAILKSIELR